MIESYIRDSGVAWTNLHPNMFMQSFLSVWSIKGGIYNAYTSKPSDSPLWRIAEVAYVILVEGPEKHNGKDYWFSADALTPHQVAQTLTAATGRKFTAEVRRPVVSRIMPYSWFNIRISVCERRIRIIRTVEDGRMAYVGSILDDTKKLLGREPLY